jgi:hypothetical protein
MSSRRFHLASVVLFLIGLALDFGGKICAGRAMTTTARGGEQLAVTRDGDWADVLTGAGVVVAMSGGVCAVVAIAKGEGGPHWPTLLFGGMYVILMLVIV